MNPVPETTGTRLSGKPVADAIRTEVLLQVEQWVNQGVQPKVVTVLVADDPASIQYAQAKAKMAARLGVEFEIQSFAATIRQTDLLEVVAGLNHDPTVHGILIELPLPGGLDTHAVTAAIHPRKDIDGLTPANRFAVMTGSAGLYPATPLACLQVMRHYGYSLASKNVVLVGRGKTVGMPLLHLLLRENATVTVCHSWTIHLGYHLHQADFAFVAVGKPDLITEDMVHPGLVVVDAGINETDDGGITGDVPAAALARVAAYTPTPGGIGTVTTAQIFANLMQAMAWQFKDLHDQQGGPPYP